MERTTVLNPQSSCLDYSKLVQQFFCHRFLLELVRSGLSEQTNPPRAIEIEFDRQRSDFQRIEFSSIGASKQ